MIPCLYIGSLAVVLVVREGKLRSAGEAVPGYRKCCHLPGGCVLPDNIVFLSKRAEKAREHRLQVSGMNKSWRRGKAGGGQNHLKHGPASGL